MQDFGLPLILVTKTDLGTINHTLMSLEIIKYKRINLHELFLLEINQKDTVDYIKTAGKNIIKQKIKILGRLPFLKKITPQHIKEFGKKVKL